MPEEMVVPDNRVVAPVDEPALLERQTQPLYSAAALAAAALPPALDFFNYTRGNNISGAGTAVVPATRYHTNMSIPNQLAKPKIFVYRGARVVIPPIVPENTTGPVAATLTDPSVGTVGVNNDRLDQLKLIAYTGVFYFELSGLKQYLEVPLWRVPGNTGLKGSASIAGTGTASVSMKSEAYYTAGRPLRVTDEVMVTSQQTFTCQIRWPSATNAAALDLTLIWSFLMGELGREVM